MGSPTDRGAERPWPRLYWAMAGVFTLFALTMLAVPFTRDQGICGYIGWIWLNGGVPYRDAFDGKGPVFYAFYALGLFFSRGEEWGVNLLDILARAAGFILAGRVAARAAGERAGLFGAALAGLPLLGIFNFMWWNAHPETFMLPMLAGSSLLVLRGNRRDLIAAGMLCGLAVLCKPTAVLHLWLAAWVFAFGDRGRGRLARAGLFLGGVVLGVVPVLIYFAGVGALDELWEVSVVYNFLYSGSYSGGGDPPIQGFWFVFFLLPLLVPFLAVRGAPGFGRPGAWFLALWLAESLAQVVGQGKFFLYQWEIALPAAGAAAGAGLAGLERLAGRRWGPAQARRLALAVLIFFAMGYARDYWILEESMGVRLWLTGSISTREYHGNFNTPDFRLLDNISAADLIRAGTEPDDAVLVFGYDPLINLLARRVSPSRFMQVFPLTFEPSSENAARMRQSWREEFMAALRAKPPALVAIADQDQNPVVPMSSWEAARRFPEFWAWLGQNYQSVGDVGNFHFFGRRN